MADTIQRGLIWVIFQNMIECEVSTIITKFDVNQTKGSNAVSEFDVYGKGFTLPILLLLFLNTFYAFATSLALFCNICINSTFTFEYLQKIPSHIARQ